MKRKYILSGLLACALTFSACDVDLLDIPQKGVENEENYYQTDEQCESAIAAIYASWRNAYSGRGEKASQYANGFFLKNLLGRRFQFGWCPLRPGVCAGDIRKCDSGHERLGGKLL